MSLVLRLSEQQLKAFFLKLLEWVGPAPSLMIEGSNKSKSKKSSGSGNGSGSESDEKTAGSDAGSDSDSEGEGEGGAGDDSSDDASADAKSDQKASKKRKSKANGSAAAAAGSGGAASSSAGALPGTAGNADRAIIFFKLVNTLIDKLGGIFVPYFGHLMDHITSYLSAAELAKATKSYAKSIKSGSPAAAAASSADVQPNLKKRRTDSTATATATGGAADSKSGDSKSGAADTASSSTAAVDPALQSLSYQNELVDHVVRACFKCFASDRNHFMGKEKFDRLLPVLVGQLEWAYHTRSLIIIAGGASGPAGAESDVRGEQYKAFIQSLLAPAIVEMAERMGNFALWQPLNHAVLMQSRSKRALIRQSSLKVIIGIYEKIREPYVVLLPETLPFVSELMQDSDQTVERLTQQLCKILEQLSGENIQQALQK